MNLRVLQPSLGLPQWFIGKDSACKAGDLGDMGSIFLPGESHEESSPVGHSP